VASANRGLTLKAEVLSWEIYTFFMERHLRECLLVLLNLIVTV